MIKEGDRFNRLTVLDKKQKSKTQTLYLCKCDCGNEKYIMGGNLRSGGTKSCGCLLIESTVEMIGKKFGHLLVLDVIRDSVSKSKNLMVRCRCDCGRERAFDARTLRTGHTNSCCKYSRWKGFGKISGDYWNRLKSSAIKRKIVFHISMEQAWQKALEQDMICPYTGLKLGFSRKREERTASLDRIDSSKGYVDGNIQWVDRRANYMKSDLTEKEFLEYIELIYKNRRKSE